MTAILGKGALLNCRVRGIGNRTVGIFLVMVMVVVMMVMVVQMAYLDVRDDMERGLLLSRGSVPTGGRCCGRLGIVVIIVGF